ncbi:hypothetical protein MsAg5_17300 [Methanosarcinaceae archaeon Ag5]|uniref:HEPN domain-containing protein n=2 Tax=Methanolapillus africanus TaxID=3028297 RepID=A0AAE4MMJ3_9EURY|nr:hypothetical protein [Methanosarcinaceae archaeon Ag5]
MTFEPAHFLYLSKCLIKKTPKECFLSESVYRTAIGRAYYAAFLEVRNYAAKNDGFISSKTGKDHKNLEIHFNRSADYSFRQIGHKLAKLKKWRTLSDYEMSPNFEIPIEKTAKRAVREATQIFSKLN